MSAHLTISSENDKTQSDQWEKPMSLNPHFQSISLSFSLLLAFQGTFTKYLLTHEQNQAVAKGLRINNTVTMSWGST